MRKSVDIRTKDTCLPNDGAMIFAAVDNHRRDHRVLSLSPSEILEFQIYFFEASSREEANALLAVIRVHYYNELMLLPLQGIQMRRSTNLCNFLLLRNRSLGFATVF